MCSHLSIQIIHFPKLKDVRNINFKNINQIKINENFKKVTLRS